MSELTGYGPGFPVGRAVETITKRELFAAMAMQGMLAAAATHVSNPHTLAPVAVACADALIAALNKEPQS